MSTSFLLTWCPGTGCDPCKKPNCLVPSNASFMGEIICYAFIWPPNNYAPQGCQYRDTNLSTGEVTETPGFGAYPGTVYAGETLIVSTTLGWSGPGGQGQYDFPDQQYTGTGNPAVDMVGVNQLVNQAAAILASAACTK